MEAAIWTAKDHLTKLTKSAVLSNGWSESAKLANRRIARMTRMAFQLKAAALGHLSGEIQANLSCG